MPLTLWSLYELGRMSALAVLLGARALGLTDGRKRDEGSNCAVPGVNGRRRPGGGGDLRVRNRRRGNVSPVKGKLVVAESSVTRTVQLAIRTPSLWAVGRAPRSGSVRRR
jgi:hypothetical protein